MNNNLDVEWLLDAVRAVANEYDRFARAKTPVDAANALVDLNNAMSDVVTYLPEFDVNTGWLR
jgi:hypothetical protein